MDMDRYLKILILRTLDLDQDEVAERLHCAKRVVVSAEGSFRICPLGEALGLVEDQRIKRLVGRDFSGIGLTDKQAIRADQLTGDDILLRYGRVRPQAVKVDPVYIKLLERHWDRLRKQAVIFKEQLSPPAARDLFAAEVCGEVQRAVQSGSSLLATHLWKQVFDAPLEIRLRDSAGAQTVEVRLLAEEEPLFPQLLSHLQAEFAEFSQFEVWKTQLGHLIEMCLERVEGVTRSCRGAAGMDYLAEGRKKWLSFLFPAYVCQFVLKHLSSQAMPSIRTELQADGLLKLMPQESPAITLALDTADHIGRCQEVLVSEVRDNAALEVWQQISSELTALKEEADRLHPLLTTVIERGSFRGTCPLCEDYFTPSKAPGA